MNTTAEKLQQMIGSLYIENILLREKIIYLENMIEQLTKGRVTAGQKEVKTQPSPGD